MIIDFLDETMSVGGLGMLTSLNIRLKNSQFVNNLLRNPLKLPRSSINLNLINQKAFVKSLKTREKSNGPKKM